MSGREAMIGSSLPTPPSTSHRDKENRTPRFSIGSRGVVWAEEHEYHVVPSDPPPRVSVKASSSKEPPARSILKHTSHVLFPMEDENQKETTPEPSDPLVDLKYLEGPVSRIIAIDSSLGDLIQAYSILAARLRACITPGTEADSSWPLFQPLRQHRDAFIDAVVRDLGRALVDPQTVVSSPFDDDFVDAREEEKLSGLPSPQKSPRKKRGMSEEQVKLARDLCTTCHAVIKLLNVMFSMPCVYAVFKDDQLRFVMTHILAIPLANELPTPNARKTNALAIWLIQTQRLPAEIILPARDRITYALRRGIEGELGKEGKKGSAADGLKAVHDLSMHYPIVVVPAFVELLPSVLANLLAPTLAMRNQACNALGGFALALASLPFSTLHTRVSNLVAKYLTTAPDTPHASPRPGTPPKDAALIRTLRTTLSATDPKQAPQGPVWGWLVLAHLIVLLGPAVYSRERLTRQVTALATLGMRHTKSSVRAMGCLVWRCMTWAYFQPPLPPIDDDGDSDEEDSGESEVDIADGSDDAREERRADTWKLLRSIVDMRAGVATLGALLGGESTHEDDLRRALGVLQAMSEKGGLICKEALEVACQLVSMGPEPEWRPMKLLVPGLFSALPGLLTAEYATLPTIVRPLFEDAPQLEDIRPLTKEELTITWVFDGLLEIWKEGLINLRLSWGYDIPGEIQDLWFGLLKANVMVFQDDEDSILLLAKHAVDLLVGILQDDQLNLGGEPDNSEIATEVPTGPVKKRSKRSPTHGISPSRVNLGLKFYLVHELWNVVKSAFADMSLSGPAGALLCQLYRNELKLVEDLETADIVRKQWALLCANVAMDSELEDLEQFWAQRPRAGLRKARREWSCEVRCLMWKVFVQKWLQDKRSWEVAVALLAVPFIDANAWDMSNEDLNTWDTLLQAVISRALDDGLSSLTVLERVASQIWAHHAPTHSSSLQVADLLLSHLEVDDAEDVPADLFEFVNDALIVSYPPEPRNKLSAMWLMRTLTRVIDTCPLALLVGMLNVAQGGLCTWIKDDYKVFTVEEYVMDILPLYQTILLVIQSVPAVPSAVLTLSDVITAIFQGRDDKPQAATHAYIEFKAALRSSSVDANEDSPSIEQASHVLESEEHDQASTIAAAGEESNEERISKDGDAVSDVDQAESALESEDSEHVALMLLPATELSSSPPSSPVLPIVSPQSFPVLADLLELPADPPSTPKGSPKQLPETPPRPHKTGVKEFTPLLLNSPASPVKTSPRRPPVTPKRPPHSASRRSRVSSGRRVSGSSKENAPLPSVVSVAERIAMRSPAAAAPSVLGKRISFEEQSEEHTVKRRKFDMLPDPEVPTAPLAPDVANLLAKDSQNISDEPIPVTVYFQDTTVVTKDALPALSSSKTGVDSSASSSCESLPEPVASSSEAPEPETLPSSSALPPRPKKRKSVFLDFVEVPTLRQVLKLPQRSESVPEPAGEATPQAAPTEDNASTPNASSSQRTLRRTRSSASLSEEPVKFLKLEDTPRKRRRDRVSELIFKPTPSPAPSESMSSPLRALREAPIAGSDDSIMLATPTKHVGEAPSSDDHYTGALGLASPAPRRVTDDDLSSDDSIASASPTRERVVRRIARLPSLQAYMRPSPLAMRPRSSSDFPVRERDSDL